MLTTLTFVVYNSTDKLNFSKLLLVLADVYFCLTLFACGWGYYIYMKRRQIILERLSKHLDNVIGPLVVAVGLMGALLINFIGGWRLLSGTVDLELAFYDANPFHKSVQSYVIDMVN